MLTRRAGGRRPARAPRRSPCHALGRHGRPRFLSEPFAVHFGGSQWPGDCQSSCTLRCGPGTADSDSAARTSTTGAQLHRKWWLGQRRACQGSSARLAGMTQESGKELGCLLCSRAGCSSTKEGESSYHISTTPPHTHASLRPLHPPAPSRQTPPGGFVPAIAPHPRRLEPAANGPSARRITARESSCTGRPRGADRAPARLAAPRPVAQRQPWPSSRS